MGNYYRKRRRRRLVSEFVHDSVALRRDLRLAVGVDDGNVGRRFGEMNPFAAPDAFAEFEPDKVLMARLRLLPWIDRLELHGKVHHWALGLKVDAQWKRLARTVEEMVRF